MPWPRMSIFQVVDHYSRLSRLHRARPSEHGTRPTCTWSPGDPTLADAILDRLVHNAYKLDLKGDSMRKRSRPSTRTESQDA